MMRNTHAPTPRYALIYTTGSWTSFSEVMYRRNAAHVVSGDVYVLANEIRGPVAVPRAYRTCVGTSQAFAALGLQASSGTGPLRNRPDYLAYLFFFRHPGYDFYVFVGADSYVNGSVDQLVEDVARSRLDHVAAPGDHGMSAVTVFSRASLAFLFMRGRQESASTAFGNASSKRADETFSSSALQLNGFSTAPLQDFGSVGSFAWWPPESDAAVAGSALPPAHAAAREPRFMRSMLRHSTSRDGMAPNAKLWGAMRSSRGWHWAVPLASEVARRVAHIASFSPVPKPTRPLVAGPVAPSTGLRISHVGRVGAACNRNGRYGIGKATRG